MIYFLNILLTSSSRIGLADFWLSAFTSNLKVFTELLLVLVTSSSATSDILDLGEGKMNKSSLEMDFRSIALIFKDV